MKWNFLARAAGRGDVELDTATERADPNLVNQAKALAAAFKPMADPTAE